MDSVRPKLSEIADENDDTSQLEDEKRRHIQACLVSAEEEDDEVVLPGSRFHPTDKELLKLDLRSKADELFMLDNIYINEYPWVKVNEYPMDKVDELFKLVVIYKQIQKLKNKAVKILTGPTIHSILRPAGHPHVNCPRCSSQSSTFGCTLNCEGQPRHFCKTCRRYWTEDDTLRNIPSFSSTSFASNRSSSAASTSKNERENSNNRGKTAETSTLKDPSTVGYDYKEDTSNQPQQSEPPSNQHPARPEVRIDIPDGNTESEQPSNQHPAPDGNTESDDDAMKIMSGTLTAVTGQVIGGAMVHIITSSAGASYSRAGSVVVISSMLGLSATFVGISLRRRSRAHSALMIKIGAVITASAIVFSMGLHLSPVIALTVEPVMLLIIALAAAYA